MELLQGTGLTRIAFLDFIPTGLWQTVTLSLIDFTTAPGESVSVRVYGWDAGHQNGWLDIDNVSVKGTIAEVPEPAPTLFLATGFLLFFLRCGLRRTNIR